MVLADRRGVAVVVMLLVSFPAALLAQHEQVKLNAPNPVGFDYFGRAVSLSGDAAVVGAEGIDCVDGSACGAAYVFRYSDGTWGLEQELTPTETPAGDSFGGSVAISEDLIVVGAVNDDAGSAWVYGSAHVYRFNGTAWTMEQKLAASDAEVYEHFGASVAVDGDVAVIGASQDNCAAVFGCVAEPVDASHRGLLATRVDVCSHDPRCRSAPDIRPAVHLGQSVSEKARDLRAPVFQFVQPDVVLSHV